MKNILMRMSLLVLACALGGVCVAAWAGQGAGKGKALGGSKPQSKASRDKGARTGADAAEAKAKLDAAMKLAPAERVAALEAFVRDNPQSASRARALELLTAARAALGDELLRTGDAARGVEMFRRAVAEAPSAMPDKLFVEVVSQLPANLFLRGESAAAFELARAIEERVKADPKRLVSLAAFYVNVEQPEEAARVASRAAGLAPDMAAAQLTLGAAHRIALRLEEAAEAFKRALELDPKSAVAQRSLADLQRAAGRSEDALTLYRALLAANPKDAGARGGLVLALFESGKREEAERELEAALKEETPNLPLLVGAAWWYLSHGDALRAQELAARAVELEPRYTWAQIALARSLVVQKRPVEAERSLRFARQYGRFPTLDYELASALAAAGLYEEAAEELSRSFTLKDGQLETLLAGRIPARAESFTTLLAPERRASIFQQSSADTEANARLLKNLLAFHLALKRAGDAPTDSNAAAAEAAAFASGDDEMRAFRQLYAASRLLTRGLALRDALALTEAAMTGVESALNAPVAVTALLADDLRDLRARHIASGTTPTFPEVPRASLDKVMRGRIEDLAGWSLFGEGKAAEAVVRLRRATSVLPVDSPWWRTAMWHLGAALDASGNQTEALAAYLRSYNRQSPDPARRAIIEGLYRRVNGTLDGLDERIGPAPVALAAAATTPSTETVRETTTTAVTTSTPQPTPDAAPAPTPALTLPTTTPAAPTPEPTPTPASIPTTSEPKTEPLPQPTPQASPTPAPQTSSVSAVEPMPEATPAPVSQATPVPTLEATPARTPESTPAPTPQPTPAPEQISVATPLPTPSPTPEPTPAESNTTASASVSPTPAPTPEQKSEPKTDATQGGASRAEGEACELVVNEETLSIGRNGSGLVTLTHNNPGSSTKIDAATANWSDIVVLAEPRAEGSPNIARYTISSVSNKPGTYVVTFTSPCGSKKLTVTVK
jgi:tetratricopeptide (TPR) repeat protein